MNKMKKYIIIYIYYGYLKAAERLRNGYATVKSCIKIKRDVQPFATAA